MESVFQFTAELWEWESRDNWFFVSLPLDVSDEIRDRPLPPAGFNSVRVRARVGATIWTTSIFPGSGTEGYALPVKRSVRVAENLELGRPFAVEVELVDGLPSR